MSYRHSLGNDRWIAEIVFPGKRNGFFIEAGALCGVVESATWYLEKHLDWDGICCEPHTSQFNRLIQNRSCRCFNSCLFDRETDVDFIETDACPGMSGIKGCLREWHRHAWENGVSQKRRTTTLSKLLLEVGSPKTIDYLALDTEGCEYEVLLGLDFKRNKPLAISVETPDHQALQYLKKNGYSETKNPFCAADYERYFILEDRPLFL